MQYFKKFDILKESKLKDGVKMAWFFTDENISGEDYIITGENARHIEKSLRMKNGEELTLCTPDGTQCNCGVANISPGQVFVKIKKKFPCKNEPDIIITLYQALPKGDKMDYIVQKCVELGVSRIIPVISARCISRPDEKTLKKKRERWQKISLQAAMQSRRGIIPQVKEAVSFEQALKGADNDLNIIFYETGGESVREIIDSKPKSIGIFIGSEGGFEEKEAQSVLDRGGRAATLGRRILRAETAPLAALSVIMYQTGNFD